MTSLENGLWLVKYACQGDLLQKCDKMEWKNTHKLKGNAECVPTKYQIIQYTVDAACTLSEPARFGDKFATLSCRFTVGIHSA